MKKRSKKTLRLSPGIFTYKNCWVALTPNGQRILVTGKKLETVLKKSEKLGFKEPALIRAPKEWGLYVLSYALSLSKTAR